jgi:putative ABC transport system permease protein
MLAIALNMAAGAMRGSMLRAALATVGMAIGVAVVIALVSLGKASEARVRTEVAALGADLLMLRPGHALRAGSGVQLPARPFELADVVAIGQQVSGVRHVAGIARQSQVASGERSSSTVSAAGTTTAYFEARRWRLVAGRLFTEYEEQIGRSVCVVGADTAERLLGRQRLFGGEVVRLGNVRCEIIGVLERRGGASAAEDDSIVAMPIAGFQRRILGKPDVHAILVTPRQDAAGERVQRRIAGLLLERRGGSSLASADFLIEDMAQIAAAAHQTSHTMAALIAAVGLLSQLMGGVGIMNVMLASIGERKREIGVRLAIGATPSDIQAQFLAESVMVALLGAILGIAVGGALSLVGALVLGLPPMISLSAVALSATAAMATGLVFGYGPAARASRLSPIEAIRGD